MVVQSHTLLTVPAVLSPQRLFKPAYTALPPFNHYIVFVFQVFGYENDGVLRSFEVVFAFFVGHTAVYAFAAGGLRLSVEKCGFGRGRDFYLSRLCGFCHFVVLLGSGGRNTRGVQDILDEFGVFRGL